MLWHAIFVAPIVSDIFRRCYIFIAIFTRYLICAHDAAIFRCRHTLRRVACCRYAAMIAADFAFDFFAMLMLYFRLCPYTRADAIYATL